MNPDDPKPCQHCGRVGTHTTICWAIAAAANNGARTATGSTNRITDPEALDRAEDDYIYGLFGEPRPERRNQP